MSYIAAAAEAERNRRFERESLDKRLDMQKYGIDTSDATARYGIDTRDATARYGIDIGAGTAANRLAFDREKWIPEEERKSTLFGQAQDIYDASTELSSYWMDTSAEQERSENIYEDLKQGEVDADQYTGFIYNRDADSWFPNLKEWWRGEGLHLWGDKDSAFDPKYDLTVDGTPIDPREIELDDELLKKVPIEVLLKYAPILQGLDIAGGGLSTDNLLSIFTQNMNQTQ